MTRLPRFLKIVTTIAITMTAWLPNFATSLVLKNALAEVYFSPHGGCQEAIVGAIASAHKSILVQAYSFTSAPIAEALKRAHDQGVMVKVILDRSQKTAHYTGLTYLQRAGISVRVDYRHAIAHNKVMIIDNDTVITGSFNFTKSAEKSNAENVIIIRDHQLAQIYTDNWQLHQGHSE